jgi:hypothetical protein
LLADREIAVSEAPMDEDNRRSLHQLIMRASDKDAHATAAIEEMIVAFDRSGSADDVAQSLQMILTVGGDALHARVVARLQENDRQRQHWPMIAQP